jgi:thiamine biosynthesis lipoprotein
MTLRLNQLLPATLLCVALLGCRSSAPKAALQRFAFQQPHMGTLFTITLYAPDEAVARAASKAAFAKIAALERIMTDYDPESELMQLCQQPIGQPVRVSVELFEVLAKAQRVAELSDGAFDATVGPVIRLWRRTRRTAELPSPELLARARAAVGWRNLKLDARRKTATLTLPNMQLDLGGLGKGFAADKALEVLKAHGVTRALIAASGDIAVSGPPPGQRGWRVSIGAPDFAQGGTPAGDSQQQAGGETGASIVRTLLLKNAASSTAGDSEQFVEIGGVHYSHIVDPRTGVGLTNRLQVSVIARRATDADAFDTTVRVLGVERGMALIEGQRELAALILVQEGNQSRVLESSKFKLWPLASNAVQ